VSPGAVAPEEQEGDEDDNKQRLRHITSMFPVGEIMGVVSRSDVIAEQGRRVRCARGDCDALFAAMATLLNIRGTCNRKTHRD